MIKELQDQSAHYSIALVMLLPVGLWQNVYTFSLLGFCLGLIREVTEEGTPFNFGRLIKAVRTSKLDLTFWTLGGFSIGILV